MTQLIIQMNRFTTRFTPRQLIRFGLYLFVGACFISSYAQDFTAPEFGKDALKGSGDDLKGVACDWIWIGVAVAWIVIFAICAFVPVRRLLVASAERGGGGGAGDAIMWSAVVVLVALITSALMYYAFGIAQTWCKG